MDAVFREDILREDIQILSELPLLDGLRGKSVLVTGATGALGAYLTHALARANDARGLNCTVTALYRDEAKARRLFDGLRVEHAVQDVRAPLPKGLRCDYILHTAGPVGPAVFAAHPEEVLSVNVAGTLSLLEHAARTSCEGFAFASTHEVYGQTEKHCVSEGDMGLIEPMRARSCYPQAKRAAETALACYAEKGLRAMSARLTRFYGPLMNLESGLFVCDFVKDVLAGQDVRVNGDASLLRPLAYVRDVAAAMLTILLRGEPGQAYNVQASDAPTIGRVAQVVAAQRRVGVQFARPQTAAQAPHGQLLCADQLQALGWQAQLPLEEGIARTLRHFEEAAR